jgi:hypothetical protein
MTIFVKAAKIFLILRLEHTIANAIAKDRSIILGKLRNADLSEEQRKLVLRLRGEIENFKGNDDKSSLTDLKTLIENTDADIVTARREYIDELSDLRGHTNEDLMKINSDLELFYNTLKRLSFNFLDIEDDKQPFHILCFRATYYFAQNIFFPHEEGMASAVANFFTGYSPTSIRDKKEKCLLKNISECKKSLNSVKEGDEFDANRLQWVVLTVAAIKRDNLKICKGAQILPTIPIGVGIPGISSNVSTTKIRPSRGRLEDCMDDVLDDLGVKADESLAEQASMS